MKYLWIYMSLFCVLNGFSQSYGNEWIDFEKDYFKIGVVEDGFYEIGYEELLNVGVPLQEIDPRTMKLVHRGEEINISIEGENDGVWNVGDKLFFYGRRNDGAEETKLYDSPEDQVHDYYSLYSDTSAYFLTWGGVSGKRIPTTSTTSSGFDVDYLVKEQLFVDTEDYWFGEINPTFISLSTFERAEGWFSKRYLKNEEFEYTFEEVNFVRGAQDARLVVALVGRNNREHRVELTSGLSTESDFIIGEFTGYGYKIDTLIIPASSFENNQLNVSLRFVGVSDVEAMLVAYMKLEYPTSLDVDGSKSPFIVPVQNQDRVDLNIENPVSSSLFDLSDLNAIEKISGTLNQSVFNTTIRGAYISKTVLQFLDTDSIKEVSFIREMNFVDYSVSSNIDYLVITNDKFFNESQQYANYRSSSLGGGHTPLVADVCQLFDQFAFGEKGPQGIRDFTKYFIDNGVVKSLFIIGKGALINYSKNFSGSRVYYRKNPFAIDAQGDRLFEFDDEVLTAGYPGSDIALTINLNDSLPNLPAIPVGRLPVREPQQVINYLDKVREYESIVYDDLWPKRVLHLSGGRSASEQRTFRTFIDRYASIAAGTFWGASTTTFEKETTANVVSFDITGALNDGISLLTYFGHSAPNFIEIDLGDIEAPENGYNNRGKYPILFLNGCNSGSIYSNLETTAENWVFGLNKGAIAAFAHTSFGYSNQLNNYCRSFYQNLTEDELLFESSIGEVQFKTINDFIGSYSQSNRTNVSQWHQMILIGDPAIKHFPVSEPDYSIEREGVRFLPLNDQPITAQSDSFQIQLAVDNFGKAINDTLSICVNRFYNNGQESVLLDYYEHRAPFYSDTFALTVPNDERFGFGNNSFVITVDCGDSIQELDEFNNTVVIDFYIPTTGLSTIIPQRYDIVDSSVMTLVAQSFDLSISETEYIFQLDTLDGFTNPLLEERLLATGLASLDNVVLPAARDSLVYYWRVRFANDDQGQDTLWSESSFMYVRGRDGWAQGDVGQFSENSLINLLRDDFVIKYDSVVQTVRIASPGSETVDYTNEILFSIGSQTLVSEATGTVPDFCNQNGVYAIGFDGSTGLAYHYLGVGNCGVGFLIDDFATASGGNGRNGLVNYINAYNPNDVIILFTIGNAGYSQWAGSVLESELLLQGATMLDSLEDGEPYIFIFRKGLGKLYEEVGDTSTSILNLEFDVIGRPQTARLTTPLIGPASNWDYLIKNVSRSNLDSTNMKVYGVQEDNGRVFLFETDNNDGNHEYDLTQAPTFVDSEQYPYLQLELNVFDTLLGLPPQLANWLVLYEGPPEGTFLSEYFGPNYYDTLQVSAGDTVSIEFAFINLTNVPFSGPMPVQWQLIGLSNAYFDSDTIFLDTLQASDTLFFTLDFATSALSGGYSLTVFANPELLPEQFYNNNILQTNFMVDADDVNPVLDVLFDGIHILDGDIVSPTPFINIAMRDDNEVLLKEDTLGWDIFLKRPCGNQSCEFERIAFTDPDIVSWTAATEEQPFKVEYNPKELPDGVYTLRIKATDASGNEAGEEPYQITFEVINASTITNFLPYPNPFSTSCRFVFTLTGSELPSRFKIQIMTVSGIVVREITSDEIGPIHIGTNITDYAWDGRDEYGGQLANGVYLYRVVMENNDQFEHRETSADRAFKKGFGKMYILR